jgi:hypothetical protein
VSSKLRAVAGEDGIEVVFVNFEKWVDIDEREVEESEDKVSEESLRGMVTAMIALTREVIEARESLGKAAIVGLISKKVKYRGDVNLPRVTVKHSTMDRRHLAR